MHAIEQDSSKYSALARSIVLRGFEVPAIFLLEMFQPLAGVMHFSYEVVSPILMPILGTARYDLIKQIISSPQDMEELLREIEKVGKNPQKSQT